MGDAAFGKVTSKEKVSSGCLVGDQRKYVRIFRSPLTETEPKGKLDMAMPQVHADSVMDRYPRPSETFQGIPCFSFCVFSMFGVGQHSKHILITLNFSYHLTNYIPLLFALTKCWRILEMHLWNIKFEVIVESEMGKLSRCRVAAKT